MVKFFSTTAKKLGIYVFSDVRGTEKPHDLTLS